MIKIIAVTIAVVTVGVIIFLSVFLTIRRNSQNSNDEDDDATATATPGAQFTPALPGAPCGSIDNDCSFVEDFSNGLNASRWLIADGWANEKPFGVWWDDSMVSIRNNESTSTRALHLSLTKVKNEALNKTFASGQVQSRSWFQYGCFEVSMKPFNKAGVVSSFFLYTGEFDSSPGGNSLHNEIDMEFIHRPHANRTILQTNHFAQASEHNQHLYFQPFHADAQFHHYGFKWTDQALAWYVDGRLVHQVTGQGRPKVDVGGPMKIFLNLWSVASDSPGASQWAGTYQHDDDVTPVVAYDWVRYSNDDNCSFTPI